MKNPIQNIVKIIMSSKEVSFNNKPLKLELYLKLVDSIEKNIDRRHKVNQFNLSTLGALAVAFGFIQGNLLTFVSIPADLSMRILATISIITCLVWFVQILRFREVSRIKHQTAMKLEVELEAFCIAIENEIEEKSRNFISYTQLELFFPVTVFVGSIVILLSI